MISARSPRLARMRFHRGLRSDALPYARSRRCRCRQGKVPILRWALNWYSPLRASRRKPDPLPNEGTA